ncbi:hypothetical protein [Streptomyces sp. NPDC127108]|uniref:hypothetical protein n=1 Tax=Streptomyces sp. NPDC127108 TaxID=3345361 RepID=UPI00362FF96F
MALGIRNTRGGTARAVRRCAVLACALASVLAVLCVCFGALAHHEDGDGRAAPGVASPAAAPGPAPEPGTGPALGHDCPPSERCAAVTHHAALTLPAPEPPAPATDEHAGQPRHSPTARPAPRGPTRRQAPDLHVLQVQRT